MLKAAKDWINTKQEKWKHQFFRRFWAANSMVRGSNPGRFGPGSFRPGSFWPGSFRPNFGVGPFGLDRWVDSAPGRFGRSLYQNVDCLGQADKQVHK